ncbi:hypothetical protein FOMPIDRAFT_1135764, partial [Fomitopsis schrenkii]
AVYFFDHCLVFDREIRFIWRRKFCLASTLYLLLHTATLSYFMLTIYKGLATLSCNVSTSLVQFVTGNNSQADGTVISSLRVYALNPNDFLIPSAVFVLSFVCHLSGLVSHRGSLIITVRLVYTMGEASLIAADVIVLIVTWYKTYATVQLAYTTGISTPFSAVMLLNFYHFRRYLIRLA